MGAAAFYLNDPAAPKPNRPAHLGVNICLLYTSDAADEL